MGNSMNILYVTGIFAKHKRDNSLGGMAKAVYINAKGMKERGHNVQILTVSDREQRWYYKGIEVVSVNARNGIDNKSDLGMMYQIFRREILIEKKIRELNSERRIDIIQYAGWFGIGLLHSNNIPAVMRISSYTKAQLGSNYTDQRVKLLSCLERFAMKRMNAVFAPSRVMAKKVSSDINKKVYVVETPYLQESVQEDEGVLKKRIGEKKYILYFGRISVDKGLYTIRDVIYKTLSEYQDVYFVFVGTFNIDGINKKEFLFAAKEYKERLIFCGKLSKDKLWPIVKNAHMILMPSLMDNFPNACAEAMSLGKIVIGTYGSSLEQFITDGYNGYLAQIGNAESLFEKIRVVMQLEPEKRNEISEKAQIRIEKLNINEYCKKIENMYQKIYRLRKDQECFIQK